MAAALRVAGLALSAAVSLLWRRWRRYRARKKFDGLDGVVSFSSRLIAAARAIESLRADALFIDPFAQLLAGPKAMARHQPANQTVDEADKPVDLSQPAATPAAHPPHSSTPQQDTHWQQQTTNPQQQQVQQQLQQQQEQPVPQYEGRQVSRLVLRTVFFDEATLMVSGQPAPRSGKVLAAVAQHMQQHQLQPCSQVVMLGAGMDTRPWRLPLPPTLSWYELDRADVLAAKQAALREAGASFEPSSSGGSGSSTASTPSSTQQGNSSSSSGGGPAQRAAGSAVQHPLRVGRWGCASADLQRPGWIDKLQEAGLDSSQPTVWSAEGLLYYLEPSSVAPMLKEAAANSPPGSFIIANFMTEEGLTLLHKQRTAAKPDSNKDNTAANTSTSNGNSNVNNGSSTVPPLAGSQSSSTAPGVGAAEGEVPQAGAASGEQSNCVAATDSSSSSGNGAAATTPGQVAADSEQQQPTGASGPQAGGAASGGKLTGDGIQNIGLLSEVKWGCPDRVEEFFAECGWLLLVRYSLTQATQAYGWEVMRTPYSKVRADSQQVQYVVGVRL